MFKVNVKTSERRQWRRSGVFIVNFEYISHLCSSVSNVSFEHVNFEHFELHTALKTS